MDRLINNEIGILTRCVTALSYIPVCLIGLSLEKYAILALFIGLDMFTGVMRDVVIAAKNSPHTSGWLLWLDAGRAISSTTFTAGIIKKFIILIVPLIIVFAGIANDIDLVSVGKVFLGGLILAEAYSIIGNIYSIRTGKKQPEFDGVVYIIQKSLDLLRKLITSNVK